jgi:hypothetical protein
VPFWFTIFLTKATFFPLLFWFSHAQRAQPLTPDKRFGALSRIFGYRGSTFYRALPAHRESVPLNIALHEFAQPPSPVALKSSLNPTLGQTGTKNAKTFETNTWVLATEFGKAKEGARLW